MASSRSNQTQLLIAGLSAAAAVSLFLWIITRDTARETNSDSKGESSPKPPKTSSVGTSYSSEKKPEVPVAPDVANAEAETPVVKNTKSDEKAFNNKIEELDRKGKALFKDKQYLEAAQAFTAALDLIESKGGQGVSGQLQKQEITLMNNRSAMYEKGDLPELALEDCNMILDKDMNHTKARSRKLRILEILKRWEDALVEVCAIQLLYMKANRNNFRAGLPVPPPPVPQSKMEEILGEILPAEVAKYTEKLKSGKNRSLPSSYTILQLLKSYSGYNAWMAEAARDGPVKKITSEIPEATDTESTATRATCLMKRGRRYVFDKEYELATNDFEEAYKLVKSSDLVKELMEGDSYARLLEWTGMVRHWHYDLEAALACYQECADLEPTNVDLLVKQAGVQMDGGKHEEAMKLFDVAGGLDPTAVDVMLHRSNLLMLQGKPDQAKTDLERCVQLRPNHVMARLRLASILAATNDQDGATRQLDMAEQEDPKSSEVQSYRGELFFTQGKMEEARIQFEKAIELEPSNPTPYVNAAMALLNTPVAPGQLPDAPAIMDLLEKAIDKDPQFAAAYMQLGQLALGTATDLAAAREVITLYDRGLENCRSPEEIKELCSMRVLAVAQVEAANMLKMETFNMQ